MEFFDCNCFIGLPVNGVPGPLPAAADLLAEMDRASIGRALVWHVAQRDYCEPVGNELLTEAIGHGRSVVGVSVGQGVGA